MGRQFTPTSNARPNTGATLNAIHRLKAFNVMTIGDLTEVPTAIEHTDQGPAVMEVGDARWRQLPSGDNEPVWWEEVKRYPPPTDTITLRRGMMFIDPEGRAIEYMG